MGGFKNITKCVKKCPKKVGDIEIFIDHSRRTCFENVGNVNFSSPILEKKEFKSEDIL